MPFPFEATRDELTANIEPYVDSVYRELSSAFMAMPKGQGFVNYAIFETGYEALKKATGGFDRIEPGTVLDAILALPICFVVLRTMLGFTPPELAYTTTVRTKVQVDQNFARGIDRKARLAPSTSMSPGPNAMTRLHAMVHTATDLLQEGVPENTPASLVHRLGKIDTQHGQESLKAAAQLGIPYAMLLYERFLGRPFAGHRDSVSELVGDALEGAIERQLVRWGVSFYKTKRAEKVPGFKQAPDFVIPSWNNPQIIVEAKISEDDGTARDKVTRIINLVNLARREDGSPSYQVVAALAGRGFAVRREDMRNLLLATNGKVFTLSTIRHIIAHTEIGGLATKRPQPEATEQAVEEAVDDVANAYESIECDTLNQLSKSS